MKVSCFFFNKVKSNFLYLAEEEIEDFLHWKSIKISKTSVCLIFQLKWQNLEGLQKHKDGIQSGFRKLFPGWAHKEAINGKTPTSLGWKGPVVSSDVQS